MTKKIALSTVVGTFLLLGYGSSFADSGSSAPVAPVNLMSERDCIVIFYHYPAKVCKSDLLLDMLKAKVPEAVNLLFHIESSNVSCTTYEKSNEITKTEGCAEKDMILKDSIYTFDTSCVVGFDLAIGSQMSAVKEKIVKGVGFALKGVD